MKICKFCKAEDNGSVPFVKDEHKCISCRNSLKRKRYKEDSLFRESILERQSKSRKSVDYKEYSKNYNKMYSSNLVNKDRIKAIKRKYVLANPDKVNAITAKRRIKRLERSQLNTEISNHNIDQCYKLSTILNKHSKISWQVDHVIPLQGNLVSGLHTPLNLQILHSYENQSKGNSYTIG